MITDQEITERMATIRMTHICNKKPTKSGFGPSSCREKVAVDMSVTDVDNEIVTKPEDVRPTHVEMQRTIESALHLF